MKHILRPITLTLLSFILMLSFDVQAQEGYNELKSKKRMVSLMNKNLAQSVRQYKMLMQQLPSGRLPRSFEDGVLLTSSRHAWTSGFYPGTLLYLFAFSKDSVLYKEAINRLSLLEKLKDVTTTHDLGFMMYCSYGNAYQIAQREAYKDILVQSAKSLASRFNPTVGCIKSWDKVMSMDGETLWAFPVIIDNMMNLELLFFASEVTGNPYYKNIAVKHAETTLKNHLRPDFSSFHVVDYDPKTGLVKSRETHQGFANNSTWSRGQAWGIYGFTMVYRETKKKKFLRAAQKMANFFLNHENLPKDKVPYWDFNVNQPGYIPQWNYDPAQYPETPRDASAAVIVASALIELAGYVDSKTAKMYLKAAEKMLTSLSSPAYKSAEGENGGFLLGHCVGGMPSNAEVDVPLTYADYYYVEAMLRYTALLDYK